MSSQEGFYTIIQYMPRPERAEGVNVGVALICASLDGPMVRMVQSNERVRLRFPEHHLDEHRFNSEKAALDRRLRRVRARTVEELRDFIGREAGHLVLTPPCPILVRSPLADLDELFEDLVGDPTKRTRRPRATTAEKGKERRKRLMSLGNAVVPHQARAAGLVLREWLCQ